MKDQDLLAEIIELRRTNQKLLAEAKSHGVEVRFASWFSFIALCVIAWRVW